MTDPRQIEIDTDRVLSHKLVHYGVIDLGSNSIRLVIYDDCGRAPFPRFNEKSFVALGEDLRTHGRFSGAGIDAAVSAILRFHAIAKAMNVQNVDVLATEATRKAENGSELVSAIYQATARHDQPRDTGRSTFHEP